MADVEPTFTKQCSRTGWLTGWPLYLIVDPLTDVFPSEGWFLSMPRNNLALVTASFAFARLVTEKLSKHLSTPPQILRVSYRRYCTVTPESRFLLPDLMATESSAWQVLSESYCEMCLVMWPGQYTHGIEHILRLTGVAVSETGSLCLRHGSDCAVHETIQQNTLHQHWDKLNSPGMREALRSAKMSWIGLLYFSRSMLDVLPFEVIDTITSAVQRQYQDDQDVLCKCF